MKRKLVIGMLMICMTVIFAACGNKTLNEATAPKTSSPVSTHMPAASSSPAATDDSFTDDVKEGIDDAGNAVRKGADDVEDAVEDGVNDVRDTVDDNTNR